MSLKDKLLNTNAVIDNEYLDMYCELMERNIENGKKSFKTQKHHIIPKFVYEQNNQEIDNTSDNVVNLLYKDHILAHYYLCLCASSDRFFYKNFLAIRYVLGNYYIMSRSELKDELTDFVNVLDEYQKLYEESRKYISEKYTGRLYVHKGNETRFANNFEEVNNYLSNGWEFGRYEKVFIHRNNREKEVVEESVDWHKRRGWLEGRLEHSVSTNQNRVYLKKDECKTIWVYESEVNSYLNEGWSLTKKKSSDKAKVAVSKSTKLLWKDEDRRRKLLESRKRYFESVGQLIWINNGSERKRIKASDFDKYSSEGWVKGKLSAQKKVWVHKDESNRLIIERKLDKYLADGWKVGKLTEEEINNNRLTRIRESNKNTCYIIKGEEIKRVPIETLEKYLSDGWVKGNGIRNKITITDGTKKKMIRPDELEKYEASGWHRGEPAKSEEWINKIKKSRLGKPTSLRGSKYINNGSREMRVKQDELKEYLNSGWELGRLKLND